MTRRRIVLAFLVWLPVLLIACGDSTGPVPGVRYVSLDAGRNHTCGVATQGSAFCWGQNAPLDLNAEVCNGLECSTRPTKIPGDVDFRSVSAGAFYSCGLTRTGEVYCWGKNDIGQLGIGQASLPASPARIASDLRFSAVTAGESHACATTNGGLAYCWGSNLYGELGSAVTNDECMRQGVPCSPRPVAVDGGLIFASISTGAAHTCGVTSAGTGYCWGRGNEGQLGNGARLDQFAPARVAGNLSFASISAGGAHACGVTIAGRGYCWGVNSYGELGTDATTEDCLSPCSSNPLPVQGNLVFTSLETGEGLGFTCGLTAERAAFCWGYGGSGQLGNGSNPARQVTPVAVLSDVIFTSLHLGGEHACGLTGDGLAYCWGSDAFGQLGDGTAGGTQEPGSTTPQPVAGPR